MFSIDSQTDKLVICDVITFSKYIKLVSFADIEKKQLLPFYDPHQVRSLAHLIRLAENLPIKINGL